MDNDNENLIKVAGCVLQDDYGRILLLHCSFNDSGLWYLPGGKVDDEETPEAAAIRQVGAELGVRVELTKVLGSAAFEHDEEQHEFYWFQARVQAGEPRIMAPDEYDDLDYIELEDLPSLALAAGAEILHNRLVLGEVDLD